MKVTVYTTSNCVQCMMTKKELAKRSVEFEEISLEAHPELVDGFKAQGLMAAPIVVAGSAIWSGFKPEQISRLAHPSNKGDK